MALTLILRNASKLPVGAGQPNFLKIAAVIVTRDHSTTLCKNQMILSKNKQGNLNLLPYNGGIASQVRMMSADHSKLWPIEKALSLSLIVLFPAAVAAPNFVFDNLLSVVSVIHFHWGLEACVADYVRPIIVGNFIPKLTMGLLYLISATTLGGLIYYNVSDIGVGKTIRKFWSINSQKA